MFVTQQACGYPIEHTFHVYLLVLILEEIYLKFEGVRGLVATKFRQRSKHYKVVQMV